MTDFRAIRHVLEPDDFAVGPDETDSPPFDLVEETIWSGFTTFSDHVAIQTSNNFGTELKLLYDLWGAWIEAVGDPDHPDHLFDPMLDAADDFKAATFNALHGFYRQAFDCLRSALELTAVGSYCQIRGKTTEFQQWRDGQLELGLGKACDNLIGAPIVAPLNDYLLRELPDSLFEPKGNSRGLPPGWARRLFANLSNYVHSRPGFTNVDMWHSNGPIYIPQAFIQTTALQLETQALCYCLVKLARTGFALPDAAVQIFHSKSIRPTKVAYMTGAYLFGQDR